MKALSIHPVYAMAIFCKVKTIECRTWKTDYRGEILICSTNKKIKDTIPGHAICTAKLVDIVPFKKEHLEAAYLDEMPNIQSFAWILEDIKPIRPIPIKGKLSLWNYDGEVEYLEEPLTDEEDEKMYHEIYEPIFI